jgi:hypothetical protein
MRNKKQGKKPDAKPKVNIAPEFNLPLWPATLPKKSPPYKAFKSFKDRPHVLIWPGRIDFDPAMAEVEKALIKMDRPVVVVADFHVGTGTTMSRRNGYDLLVVHTRDDGGQQTNIGLSPSQLEQQRALYLNLLYRATHLLGVRGTKGLQKLKSLIREKELNIKVKTFDPIHPGAVGV